MRYFNLAILLIIIGASFGILIGYLGILHPALDTFSHLRLHASLGLMALGLFVLFQKWILTGCLAVLIAASGLYTAASGTLLTARSVQADPTRPIYSMLHFNLLWKNQRQDEVIDRVFELDPDLISLTEVAERWLPYTKKLDSRWPFEHRCNEISTRGGIRFYSKWPIIEDSKVCDKFATFAKVNVTAPNGLNFTSGTVHMRWPWPASGPKKLNGILPELRKIGNDALLSGDFNATTWSYAVKKFATTSGMQVVPGIGSTWILDKIPLRYTWWAGLPIDNVLEKGKIKVLSAETLADLGSDHLPVWIKFQIK